MKTITLTLFAICICMSCTKETVYPETDMYLTFDYNIPKTGNISKGYLSFFNKYIDGRVLTPRTYYANLYNTGTQALFNISGRWGEKNLFAVPPGNYTIEGFSWPVTYNSLTAGSICGDTCYLKFNDVITVNETSTNIILDAKYDCSLILLDTAEVLETLLFIPDTSDYTFFIPYYKAVKKTMAKTDEFYHSFIFDLKGGYDPVNMYLSVTLKSMFVPDPSEPNYMIHQMRTFPLWMYNMDAGKYYYFEYTENDYTLTPMTNK